MLNFLIEVFFDALQRASATLDSTWLSLILNSNWIKSNWEHFRGCTRISWFLVVDKSKFISVEVQFLESSTNADYRRRLSLAHIRWYQMIDRGLLDNIYGYDHNVSLTQSTWRMIYAFSVIENIHTTLYTLTTTGCTLYNVCTSNLEEAKKESRNLLISVQDLLTYLWIRFDWLELVILNKA